MASSSLSTRSACPVPNGAGKSTAGKVRILGHDVIGEPVAAKRQLDVMPQVLALYEDLSATENLNYWGAAYGLGGTERKQRVRETLEFVALVDRAEEPWAACLGAGALCLGTGNTTD